MDMESLSTVAIRNSALNSEIDELKHQLIRQRRMLEGQREIAETMPSKECWEALRDSIYTARKLAAPYKQLADNGYLPHDLAVTCQTLIYKDIESPRDNLSKAIKEYRASIRRMAKRLEELKSRESSRTIELSSVEEALKLNNFVIPNSVELYQRADETILEFGLHGCALDVSLDDYDEVYGSCDYDEDDDGADRNFADFLESVAWPQSSLKTELPPIRVELALATNGGSQGFNCRLFHYDHDNDHDLYSSATCHPHVLGEGSPCFGTGVEMLSVAWKEHDWMGLSFLLVAFLQSVDVSDCAGKYALRFWAEKTCANIDFSGPYPSGYRADAITNVYLKEAA